VKPRTVDRSGALSTNGGSGSADRWCAAFHAGDRGVLERVYREHGNTLKHALARLLEPADCETALQEIFLRLLSNTELRALYRGGSLRAWLCALARNQAIDWLRRKRRERLHGVLPPALLVDRAADRWGEQLDAQRIVQRFCRDVLPEAWRPLFDARFIRELAQREAAHELGIHRSTLAYREQRIRSLLRSFLQAEHSRARQPPASAGPPATGSRATR
jgi:RNA polymerase sigma-70 factor, ECF subfamily